MRHFYWYFYPLCSMVVWFLITVILRTALEKMMMLYSPLRFLPLMHFLCREETKSRVVEKQGRKRNIFCCKLLSMVLVSSHCIQGLFTLLHNSTLGWAVQCWVVPVRSQRCKQNAAAVPRRHPQQLRRNLFLAKMDRSVGCPSLEEADLSHSSPPQLVYAHKSSFVNG